MITNITELYAIHKTATGEKIKSMKAEATRTEREAATLAKVRGLEAGAMEEGRGSPTAEGRGRGPETEGATGGPERLSCGEGEAHGEEGGEDLQVLVCFLVGGRPSPKRVPGKRGEALRGKGPVESQENESLRPWA